MAEITQLFSDTSKKVKAYPITSSGAVFHGKSTVSAELELLKAGQKEAVDNARTATEALENITKQMSSLNTVGQQAAAIGILQAENEQQQVAIEGLAAMNNVNNGKAFYIAQPEQPSGGKVEVLAGRQLGSAPELDGDHQVSPTPSNISFGNMTGETFFASQTHNTLTINPKNTIEGIVQMQNGVFVLNGTVTNTGNILINQAKSLIPEGHRMLWIFAPLSGSYSGTTSGLTAGYAWPTYTNKPYGYVQLKSENNYMLLNPLTGTTFNNYTVAALCFDLDAVFASNVNMLNSIDFASNTAAAKRAEYAYKFLHRLGIFAYKVTGATVEHLQTETFKLAAESLCKLEYVEPSFKPMTCGRINLIDGDSATASIKQTIDLRGIKKAAWKRVLAALKADGVDVDDPIMQNPFDASIEGGAGIVWDATGVTVGCWIVNLGKLTWSYATIPNSSTGDQVPSYTATYAPVAYATAILPGYTSMAMPTQSSTKWITAQRGSATNGNIYISKDTYTDANKIKTALNGKYMVFTLRNPVRVDYDGQRLDIGFFNAKPTDLITLDDMDGMPMHKVRISQSSGSKLVQVSPHPDWLARNKQLPPSIKTTISGFGSQTLDYDFFMQLRADVDKLMAER